MFSGENDGKSANGSPFAEDFREEPYWWRAAPLHEVQEARHATSERSADVVVIGSGITGIVAALELARGGASVLVLDTQEIGAGAARRSAGMVGRSSRRSVSELTAKFGIEHARRVYRELDGTMQSVHDLVARENIECHLEVRGRFVAANSAAHLDNLVKYYGSVRDAVGFDFSVVRKEDTRTEVASDLYHGGIVVPALGAMHPGMYHAGLVRKAAEAGVKFAPETEAVRITGKDGRRIVHSSRGEFSARNVVIATNGYTTRNFKWMARRLVPFRAFMIATEELSPDLIDKLIPHRRTYVDSFTNSEYFRPAPDTNRILFGGRTGTMSDTAVPVAAKLRDRLAEIMPDLKGVRLSRAWLGRCAVSFDMLPHTGQHEGIHYALGYNFSGINLGTSFGMRMANRILERPVSDSVFENAEFPTIPFYDGRPWFVPIVMRYYAYRDAMMSRR